MKTDGELLLRRDRGGWVRLRTLILLRWIAIVGQLTAITVAHNYYGMQLELGLCYLAVGISVIANLIAIFIFPENKRLTESQNFLMIFFDLLQLGFLLFLTGGLNNPFALLILGPVTISAAILELRSFVVMSFAAITMVTVLLGFYWPLRTADGMEMQVPDILKFGHWTALVIAVLFLGLYSRRLSIEMHSMSDALTATQMALAREQKLTDLGGVVAAAAHELGTPLATIKLASAELIEELDGNPSLQEDAQLIREQTDRCRDILRDMGRAGKDDLHLRRAPLSAVIHEAAQPHEDRGIEIHYAIGREDQEEADQPSIFRKPEIIHGLRNLIQNAVDFATENVWIEASWSSETVTLRIIDDGPGFPGSVIGRIGDPFMSGGRRYRPRKKARPAYEGMGLGLFIAKTLLERSGAELAFINGGHAVFESPHGVGAIVDLTWPRATVDSRVENQANGLGQNEHIRA